MSEIGDDYYAHPHVHYANDEKQATLTMVLLAVAAIGSVLLILWAVM